MSDEEVMRLAIADAQKAIATGDVPVGAILLNREGEIIASGRNEREHKKDPTAHAEIVVIRSAANVLDSWRLDGCTLYVTLEPCAMCASAISQSRIATVVFGAWDEKAGAVGSLWDLLRDPRALHKVEVRAGVLADECASLLKKFFQEERG